jgi:hypothetical protein
MSFLTKTRDLWRQMVEAALRDELAEAYQADVAEGRLPVQVPTRIKLSSNFALEDGDYTLASEGIWLGMGKASLRVRNMPDGIQLRLWKNGEEDGEPEVELFTPHEVFDSDEIRHQRMMDAQQMRLADKVGRN